MPENPPRWKRLYVAGPMRKQNLYNFPAFFLAQADLLAARFSIFSPAEMDHLVGFNEYRDVPDEAFLAEAMRRDRNAITLSNGVALLSGWERSEGAREEVSYAKSLGLECKPVADWLDVDPRLL